MSENFKGALQEWTQKQNLPLPTYNTWRLEHDEYHCPEFQSSFSFLHENQMSQFTGNIESSKKRAEASAAQSALQGLQKIKQHQTIHISPTKPIYILCDLENIPMKKFLEQHTFEGPIYFYGFCAHDHSSSQNRLDSQYPILTQIVYSTRRDACDVSLVMFATRLLLAIPQNAIFLVVTTDRFGAALTDCVNSNFLQLNIPAELANRAVHVTNINDLLQSILVFRANQ